MDYLQYERNHRLNHLRRVEHLTGDLQSSNVSESDILWLSLEQKRREMDSASSWYHSCELLGMAEDEAKDFYGCATFVEFVEWDEQEWVLRLISLPIFLENLQDRYDQGIFKLVPT